MSNVTKQTLAVEEWFQQRITQEPTGWVLSIAVILSFGGPIISSLLISTGPAHPVTVFPMGCVTIWLWWHLIAIQRKEGFDWTENRYPYWYVVKCPDVD